MTEDYRRLPRNSAGSHFGPVRFASEALSLAETTGSGLPLVIGEDGLCEPITVYLYYRRRDESDSSGTLAQVAYVLRSFMVWLRRLGVHWLEVKDTQMAQWLHEQRALQSPRLKWKAFLLFDFYRRLQEDGYLELCCGVRASLVGVGPTFPIRARAVERMDRSKGGRRLGSRIVLEPAFARPFSTAPRRGGRRRVPTADEVSSVLARLFDRCDQYIGARNWFLGAFMAFVGLRREGVASLSIPGLEAALEYEGVPIPLAPPEHRGPGAVDGRLSRLEALAYWPEGQDQLIHQLKQFGRYRDALNLRVVEKGAKERKVEVPVELFCAVLRLWVWDHRARFIERLAAKKASWSPPSRLWLSCRTKAGLRPNSIGNTLKRACRAAAPEARNPLSGHRLRAYYLTQLIQRLYRKDLAIRGKLVDINAILLLAAELAGHERPESLRSYVDMEQLASIALEGQSIFVANPSDAELIRGLSDGLSADVPGLREAVRAVALRHQIPDLPEPHTAKDAVALLERLEKLQRTRRDSLAPEVDRVIDGDSEPPA